MHVQVVDAVVRWNVEAEPAMQLMSLQSIAQYDQMLFTCALTWGPVSHREVGCQYLPLILLDISDFQYLRLHGMMRLALA